MIAIAWAIFILAMVIADSSASHLAGRTDHKSAVFTGGMIFLGLIVLIIFSIREAMR